LKRWSLTSHVTLTPTTDSNSPPRLTYPKIFSTCLPHFNIFLKRRCLSSKVTPTLTSDSDFPPRLTYPTIFIDLSTSILTFSLSVGALPPTSPLRCHQIPIRILAMHTVVFFTAYLPLFLLFLEAVGPYLQRHPYANFRFGFPNSPYLPYDLYPPLYLRFNFFLMWWSLTSNVRLLPHRIRIPFLALPTKRFFSTSLPPF